MKTNILFTYYDNFSVRQDNDNSIFHIYHNEQKGNRSFDQLSSAVIYCMASANNISSAGASVIADLFTTYLNANCK